MLGQGLTMLKQKRTKTDLLERKGKMIVEFENKRPQIGANVFIAPTAVIIGDVFLEEDVSIWFGAVLRGDLAPIRVGRQTNIQDNCIIHTDHEKPTIIGANVTIGHNAVIHGCTVEDTCLIGIGAIVLNEATVKAGSVVAAGSVVRERQVVGPNHLVAGSPAKVKRELDAAMVVKLREPAQRYAFLKDKYALK